MRGESVWWKKRPWAECAGNADTTECIERALAIAHPLRQYTGQAGRARRVQHGTHSIRRDRAGAIRRFCAVLGLLVTGQRFDEKVSDTLVDMVDDGTLPFHATTQFKSTPPSLGDDRQPLAGQFSSPDALFMPRWMARTADDPTFIIEPASRISTVYGMPCAIYNLLPTVYYLAARFRGDFESAILHAVNGGGHNQARAMLTGSLVGAQVGLSGIPPRFIEGLNDRKSWFPWPLGSRNQAPVYFLPRKKASRRSESSAPSSGRREAALKR